MFGKFKKLSWLLIFIGIMIFPVLSAEAISLEDYDFIKQEDQSKILHAIEYSKIVPLSVKTEGCIIASFDVNEKEEIVVLYEKGGFYTNCQYYLNIFDSNGNFEYGIQFYNSGACRSAWIDGYAAFIDVRADSAMLIDEDCLFHAKYDFEGRSIYDYLDGTERTVGGTVYTVKNGEGVNLHEASRYSIITKRLPTGEEITLIDETETVKSFFSASNISYVYGIAFPAAIIIALLCTIFIPLCIRKRKKRSSNGEPGSKL